MDDAKVKLPRNKKVGDGDISTGKTFEYK